MLEPLSNFAFHFSVRLYTVAHRNAILSRTDTALRAVRASLEDVETFSQEYLATPFGDVSEDIVVPAVGGGVGKGVGGEAPSGEGGAAMKVGARAGPSTPDVTWLDYMYDDTARSGLAGPLPQSVVAAMEEELKELEAGGFHSPASQVNLSRFGHARYPFNYP